MTDYQWANYSLRSSLPPDTHGHVVLFEPKERKVFVGDVLFAVHWRPICRGPTEQS